MAQKEKVVVGLSGGVDSSVTAKILIDQGYEVIGVFMKNWDDVDDPHCPASSDAIDARAVANQLGIPFFTVNLSKEYWNYVFEYFLDQHRKNRTPNPDILCNKYIKFAHFLEHAKALGADKIATGHYAKNYFNKETERYELQVPEDASKDQTYFLYTLTQDQLSQALFPLADIPKSQVREMALKAGFHNAKKKDSTGICFVGERDYMAFLQKYLHKTLGNMVTESGQVIGQHIGLSFYTIGQRKNLNIGGVKNYDDAPWYVLEKNIEANELVVCQDTDNPKLFHTILWVENPHWISGVMPENSKIMAQIRYRQVAEPCTVFFEDLKLKVIFDTPQRAITPGQSIVFYSADNQVCLGGGEIM